MIQNQGANPRKRKLGIAVIIAVSFVIGLMASNLLPKLFNGQEGAVRKSLDEAKSSTISTYHPELLSKIEETMVEYAEQLRIDPSLPEKFVPLPIPLESYICSTITTPTSNGGGSFNCLCLGSSASTYGSVYSTPVRLIQDDP